MIVLFFLSLGRTYSIHHSTTYTSGNAG